jgi:hypothetical protein
VGWTPGSYLPVDFPDRKLNTSLANEESEEAMTDLTPEQARAALDTVERSRRRVVDEIAVPPWYWAGISLGWVGLGTVSDLVSNAWVASAVTLAFGAVHAWVAPQVVSGRHGSRRLSVGAHVAGRQITRAVLGGLIAMVAVTVGAALLLNADGARHPSIEAAVLVAVVIALGGPLLLDTFRRRAARSGAAA